MKKSARQLSREIAQALASPQRRAREQSSFRVKNRLSHATKVTSKERGKTSDKINIDQLAELLGLPSWERVDEMNQQHYWENARGAEDEEAQLEAERAAQDDVYAQWYDAVEHAASKLFNEHDLELNPAGKWHPSTYTKTKTESRPHQLKIMPGTSWNASADKLRETVNGVGDFHFDNLRDFLDSGPYTARQAVLSHLDYIKRQPHVYGGSGAHQMYERHWG